MPDSLPKVKLRQPNLHVNQTLYPKGVKQLPTIFANPQKHEYRKRPVSTGLIAAFPHFNCIL